MAEMKPVTADGHTGKVEFDGRTIRIERPGLRGKIGYGGKPSVIDVTDVTRVRVLGATITQNGSVTFFTPGHKVDLEATDKNTVIFTKRQAAAFEVLAAAVRRNLTGTAAEPTAPTREKRPPAPIRARYDSHAILGNTYQGAIGVRELAGATALYESGADKSRPTLTRIGAGAIIAGPIGAIGGALFKKQTTKGYVTIGFANGESLIIEGPAKHEGKMRSFAAAVNAAAANAAL